MNNLLSLKKNLLIVVLLDLTLLILVSKLLMKVSLARTMLGSFLGLYILNGEQRSRRLKNRKICKKEIIKSIALKAKKESSDDETSTSGSDDKEYAMDVRNFKKFFRRKGKFVRHQERKELFRQRDGEERKNDRNALDG
ncbi:hypothetical protein Tco_0411158 [Tanacetum coccineum]